MKTTNNKKNPYYHEPGWLPEEYRCLTGKSILVLNDSFTAMKLARENNVLFVTADERAERKFTRVIVNNPVFGMDDSVVLIDEWSLDAVKTVLYKYIKENKMEKFDIVIMNPPYKTPLCYQILKECSNRADKVVYIGPIQNIYKALLENKAIIEQAITSIDYIDVDDMRAIFDIGIRIECGIVTVDNKAVCDISRYSKFWPNMDLFKRIRAKITDRLIDHLDNSSTNDFSCRVFWNCKWTPDWGGAAKDYKYAKMTNKVGHTKYLNTLKSEEERYNFWNTCVNSKFMKFLMSFSNIKDIPYMGDYTRPWTDDRFRKHFELTDSEWNIVHNAMEKYIY